MGLSAIRMLMCVAIIFNLPVVTKCQDSTCDASVLCNCCADGGINCVNNPNYICEGPCVDGYYGARCLLACPEECISCDQVFGQTKECFKCINGSYGKACTEACSNCRSCSKDTGVCVDCANGYYGPNCTSRCSQTCVNQQCDILSGRCKECSIGYFGDTCNYKCSDTCQKTSCDRTSGVCQQCVNGYYGEYCDTACSKNCLDTCNMITGICTHCISGRYGMNCDLNCSSSCSWSLCEQISGTCIQGCVENFDGDKCEDCIIGKYGTKCDKICPPNCDRDVCTRNSGTCAFGCKPGYSDSKLCCVNNINCNLCSSHSDCKQCIDGMFGQKCEHSCPGNCEGPCAKINGICDQCKLSFYGSRCEYNCSETCFTTGDFISRCNPENGKCEFGCVSGFYGNMCEFSCSDNCYGTCHPYSGECYSCKYNRYGRSCEHMCYHACIRNGSKAVCSKSTGSCLHGCLHGLYDDICDKNCSVGCQNKSCDRYTGYCINGCAEGFSGKFCVAETRQDTRTVSNDSSSFVLPVSLGIAAASLIAVTVICVVFIKRIISMRKRTDLPRSSSTYEDLNTDLRATDDAYSGVSYDNTRNNRDTQVYINTTIQQNNDTMEPGPYVNMM